MGKFQSLPIVGGCYADDARPYSVQDTVNYLPVKAEVSGTRSEGKLVCVPGLVPFCGTNQAPIRGAHNCEGRYFVVAGTTLYQISTLGARTTLGTIPGTGRVCFDHNQITGGNEVVVVNGSQGFVYNTKTGVFAQITDQDFPGSAIARYLGQYILGIKPDRTGWFHSDLATATTYLSTDTYEAESSPDLLVDIQVSQGRALIMGERTIEEWVNEPTENAAFQRGSVIERGAASPFANVIMDNTLIWLGDDGIVYRLDGYTPRRISTFPIEQALSRNTLANAFAFAWEDRGHKVFYLTLPDGHTWGYDIASGLWHRRESYRLDRWVANTMTRWNGDWYAGHYDSGVIYRLDWDVMREGCDELVRSRTAACIHDNENRVTVDAIALTVDMGTEPTAPHALATITGNLGDDYTGGTVSYQYVITNRPYPAAAITFSILSGTLPAGLSLSSSGLITGTRTTVGNYSWVVGAVDDCGNLTRIQDYSNTWGTSAFNPETTAVKYLVVGPSDATDYSSPSFDDSAWATGLAPFGNIDNSYAQSVGFKLSPVTNWPLGQKLWYRARIYLSSTAGVTADIFGDDASTAWINGTQFYYKTSGGASGSASVWYTAGVTVPAANLVVGWNDICFMSQEIYGGQSYFDYRLNQTGYVDPGTPASAASVVTPPPAQPNPAPDHFIDICYSKDGGHNWSNWRTISTGGVGAYQTRVVARRFGMGRSIVFQTRDSSPRRCDILAMSVQVSPGS